MQEYTTHKEFKKQCQDILNVLQDILDLLQENKVTVVFDVSGMGDAPGNIVVYRNQTYGELPVPFAEGYDFQGWFLNRWTNTSGDYEYSNEITNLTTVSSNGTITLYAKWTASWVEVSLNANGGTVNPEKIYVQYLGKFGDAKWGDGYVGKGLPTPVKPESSLSCWRGIIDTSDIPNDIYNESVLSIATALEISAMWTVGKFTLSYDVQNATGYLADIINIPYETEFSLYTWNDISSMIQHPGYAFLGWSRTPMTRDIISFVDGVQKITITKNTKVYAIWDNETYKIKYYDFNGSLSKEQTTKLNVPDYLLPVENLFGNFKNFNHWDSTPGTYADYCKFKDNEIIYNLTEIPNEIVSLSASKDSILQKVVKILYEGSYKDTYESGELLTISGLNFIAFFENPSLCADVTDSIRIYPTVATEGMENFQASFRFNTGAVYVDIPITVNPFNRGKDNEDPSGAISSDMIDYNELINDIDPEPDLEPDPDPEIQPILPDPPDPDPIPEPAVEPIVSNITISHTEILLKKGEQMQLSATETTYIEQRSNDGPGWMSSNTDVLTVAGGHVVAREKGSAIITVVSTDGRLQASCNATVYIPATKIELSKSSLSLVKGNTYSLTVTVSPDTASNKNVTWSTSNSKVATVSNGKITAIGKGTAIITVKHQNLSALCTITVSEVPSYTLAPSINSKTQYWYGRVNYWADSGTLQRREIEYMKSVGLTGYIIEMAEWGNAELRQGPTTTRYKNWVKKIETYYKHLHGLCKQYGLWLFVCIVNDNALSSKHGNVAVDPKHYYNNVATDLLKIILEDGFENVIVQPISELYSSRVSNHPGPNWQKNAISKLRAAKFKTCNNDAYGRPSSYGGCNFLAWHPNNISHKPSGGTKSTIFLISDTGGIISELNGGTNCDKMDANCNPSKVKQWRNSCSGYAVCGYYDFKRKSFNEAAIKAMAGK